MDAAEQNPKEAIARKFALGQILDIEVQDVAKTRFQGPLLGMKEGKYLITDLPNLTRHGNLRDMLLDEQELIVRTIFEKTTGECLGFKSSIQTKLKLPDQLLFLTFPPQVKIHELRNEKRLVVAQRATLQMGEMKVAGTLMDFSANGCRFEFELTDKLTLKRDDKARIAFSHPENGAAMDKLVRVCSNRNYNGVCIVGMAFEK